jgi:hypothetical protein
VSPPLPPKSQGDGTGKHLLLLPKQLIIEIYRKI